ncbi:MAG: PsiF family protein [Betaproteobacteria bacterium]
MRLSLALIAAALLSVHAHAAEPTCSAAATEKKLAGAAKNSFMKKCEADAQAKCEAAASEKKLAGAAKNSNVKKCVGEAVGG